MVGLITPGTMTLVPAPNTTATVGRLLGRDSTYTYFLRKVWRHGGPWGTQYVGYMSDDVKVFTRVLGPYTFLGPCLIGRYIPRYPFITDLTPEDLVRLRL